MYGLLSLSLLVAAGRLLLRAAAACCCRRRRSAPPQWVFRLATRCVLQGAHATMPPCHHFSVLKQFGLLQQFCIGSHSGHNLHACCRWALESSLYEACWAQHPARSCLVLRQGLCLPLIDSGGWHLLPASRGLRRPALPGVKRQALTSGLSDLIPLDDWFRLLVQLPAAGRRVCLGVCWGSANWAAARLPAAANQGACEEQACTLSAQDACTASHKLRMQPWHGWAGVVLGVVWQLQSLLNPCRVPTVYTCVYKRSSCLIAGCFCSKQQGGGS